MSIEFIDLKTQYRALESVATPPSSLCSGRRAAVEFLPVAPSDHGAEPGRIRHLAPDRGRGGGLTPLFLLGMQTALVKCLPLREATPGERLARRQLAIQAARRLLEILSGVGSNIEWRFPEMAG